MTHTEARALASQFGTRMCDENGDTHGEELYCFDLDDIIALKETLAQPEQEPVAILNHAHGVHTFRNVNLKGLPDGEYLIYTHPAQRTWVGLTFAEICECENDYLHLFARAIEAKLKQKNGYAEEKNT